MRIRKILAIASLVVGFIGCQPVFVQRPLGEPVSGDLSKRFDGVWQTDDNRLVFYVKANADGLLDVAGIEWRDGKFVVRDTSCIITRLGEWTCLNVPMPPDSAGKRYFLFAPFVEAEDGKSMVAFIPSYDFFKEAIDGKELVATIGGEKLHYVQIDDPQQAFFERRVSSIVQSGSPVVLKRTRIGASSDAWPDKK